MPKLPRYLNHVSRSTLMACKIDGAIADLNVISNYLDEGAYAADDVDMLMKQVESLSVSINELRVGAEISAEARCVSDQEFEDMIDEADPDED